MYSITVLEFCIPAVVTILNTDEVTGEQYVHTANVLEKGYCFGVNNSLSYAGYISYRLCYSGRLEVTGLQLLIIIALITCCYSNVSVCVACVLCV